MIIMGVDPGYRFTGYGIVRYVDGQVIYLASGQFQLAKMLPTAKLVFLARALNEVMDSYQPVAGACEEVFFAQNHQSCIKLGKVNGVASCVMAQRMPVVEYASTAVKKAVCGKGTASKLDVLAQMQLLLNLPHAVSHDEADALAVALCYLVENEGLVLA